MNLKNKTLALVVASALVMPSALAVEGSDGMHYTSAGEGFYASIRLRFSSGTADGENASVANQGSRLGVQGTSEMSHGLEGFYRYETAFDVDNGESGFGDTRIGLVGLRGGFGSIRFGSDWADEYNFVYGATDIANVHSGYFPVVGRSSRSIYYKSPDFNGLQVAARFEVDGDTDSTKTPASVAMELNDIIAEAAAMTLTADQVAEKATSAILGADSELDAWALSAKYDFSGFTVGGTYVLKPDYAHSVNLTDATNGTVGTAEDLASWALRGSYGQDNWGVSTWYGETNWSKFSNLLDDETVFSIAGNVAVGPSGVYVVHDAKETAGGFDDARTTFGVEYNFNSKAKTWIEYAAQDLETDESAEDYVTIGLRHDF